MSTSTERETRLRTLFEQHSTRVLAYALRHIDAAAAQDVVGDVFLVAWRRIDEVPDPALPWLLVVARNTIHNKRRGDARRQRLADALAAFERSVPVVSGAEDVATERAAMLAALTQLSAAERESVLLTAWDGLTVGQAATVAGCSPHAFEVRLHRARSRLRRELALDPEPPGRAAARPHLVKELPS